jgi:hypothetical protein
MNNLLPRVVHMHHKYDMKGSTYKRRASAKERDKTFPTFKDLDFIQDLPDGLLLETDNYNALSKTIQRDCLVREGGCVCSVCAVWVYCIVTLMCLCVCSSSCRVLKSWTTVYWWGSITWSRLVERGSEVGGRWGTVGGQRGR